jgi:serine/threonine-protein kinase HipA
MPKGRFPTSEMEAIIEETLSRLDSVIEEVNARLPEDFPGENAESIFDGMRKAAGKFA